MMRKQKIDYSIKKNQIGCGYCVNEEGCTLKEKGVNKAKLGCPYWKHWQDAITRNKTNEKAED